MSCSKYDMYHRCGYAFFRRYIMGEKSPPTGALAFGQADDVTKNDVYDVKIETGVTETAASCMDRFAAKFDEVAEDVEDWKGEDKGKLMDTGVQLIHAWRDECAVPTHPIATQMQFHVPVDYGQRSFDFMGYVDFVQKLPDSGANVITDNKTSGRRWGASKVKDSSQAVGYGVAAAEDEELKKLRVNPNDVHFHVAVKSKTPQIQTPESDPALIRTTDQTEREGFKRMLARAHINIAENIESGAWMPNRTNFLCSKRWCGYWRECQAEFGGEIKD